MDARTLSRVVPLLVAALLLSAAAASGDIIAYPEIGRRLERASPRP